MELESYFDFLSPEEIRIRGTRIGIETILEDYLAGVCCHSVLSLSPNSDRGLFRNRTAVYGASLAGMATKSLTGYQAAAHAQSAAVSTARGTNRLVSQMRYLLDEDTPQ